MRSIQHKTCVTAAIFASCSSVCSPNRTKQLCSACGGSGQQIWSYKTAGDRCPTSQQLSACTTPQKQLLHQESEVESSILPANNPTSEWYLKKNKANQLLLEKKQSKKKIQERKKVQPLEKMCITLLSLLKVSGLPHNSCKDC